MREQRERPAMHGRGTGYGAGQFTLPLSSGGNPLSSGPVFRYREEPVGRTVSTLALYPFRTPIHPQRKLADYLIDDLFPLRPRAAKATLSGDLAEAGFLIRQGAVALSRLHVQIRLGRVLEVFRLDRLIEAIGACAEHNPHALTAAARSKTHNASTRPIAIAALMACFADTLGLSLRERREAILAGLLHDIGMLAVPAALLDKRAPLRRDELAAIHEHVVLGEAHLATSFGLPPAVLIACRQHHERIDGSGYPDALAKPEITRLSRMLAICDSYDAIVSPRSYRRAIVPAKAHREMQRGGGLDPSLLGAFADCIGPYPLGSLVQLTSGKLGAVTGFRDDLVRRPIVTVFQSAISGRRLDIAEMECAVGPHERGVEAIVSAEDPDRWRFEQWEETWPSLAARDGMPDAAPRAVA